MSDEEVTGGSSEEDHVTPRAHPEEPAEGADEGQYDSEEPEVPRQHAQEPAEGGEEPGEPR